MKAMPSGRSIAGGEIGPGEPTEEARRHFIIGECRLNFGLEASGAIRDAALHNRCTPSAPQIPIVAHHTFESAGASVRMTTRVCRILGLGRDAKIFTTIVESVAVQMINNKTFVNWEDQAVQSENPLSVKCSDVREGIPNSPLPTGIPTEVFQKMSVLLINPQDHSVGEFATSHEPAAASTHMIA